MSLTSSQISSLSGDEESTVVGSASILFANLSEKLKRNREVRSVVLRHSWIPVSFGVLLE